MRRFVRRVLVTAVVTAVTIGVLAAAPVGAAEAIEPSEWGDGFCTALVDWQSGARSARDVVDGVIANGVASSTKAKVTRKKLVRALEDASEGAQRAGDSIQDLGPPDVTNGTKISKTASTAMYETGETFADAAEHAAKFSTDPKKFKLQVRALKKQVDDGLNQAGEDISAIDSLDADGTLDAALSSEPACSPLSSS